jgi:bifunctional non-homologous end joining protein LigD
MVFDVIWLDGKSLTKRPYTERREILASLELHGPAWRTPANHVGNGGALLQASLDQGLEGIMAKRLESTYEPGKRPGSWLKVKNTRSQELVVGGWLPGQGRRLDKIGALLVGYYDGDELRYAGKVGTGFTESELERLAKTMKPLRRDSSPFEGRQPKERDAQFIDPDLVAEVDFTEWTKQLMLRHPSYKGLRDDKDPREVVLEKPE